MSLLLTEPALADVMRLPAQRVGPSSEEAAPGTVVLSADDSLSLALIAMADAEGVSVAEALLAAWAVWLHRLSEQADVTVALPAGADGGWSAVTIAVGDADATTVLQRASRAWRQAPGADRLEGRRLTSGFACGPAPLAGPLPCALLLTAHGEGDRLEIALHFDPAVFAPSVVGRFAEGFATLVADMARRPEARVEHLAVVGATERRILLETWAPAAVTRDFPLVHVAFEARAASTPEAIAVVSEHEAWRCAAVNARANRMAHHLRALGAGPGRVVALYLGRSIETPVAMLAVLKTGAAYVVIETSVPDARACHLLEVLERPMLLTAQRPPEAIAERAAVVVALDEHEDALAACSDENLPFAGSYLDAAAIYFTSGSSGDPKPLVYTHRALGGAVAACVEGYGFNDTHAYLYATPYAFIASIFVFIMLNAGTRLVLANQAVVSSPLDMLALVREAGITHLGMVPTFWRAIMRALDGLSAEARAELLDNRVDAFLTGGEAVTPDVVTMWRERFAPGMRVLNCYGQTETTTVAFYDLPQVLPDQAAMPVGRPLANCAIYLLNEHLEPVPIGTTGMIYARSEHMASGYWGAVEGADEKLIPNPFGPGRLCKMGDLGRFDEAGNLTVVGRGDQMLKIRGQRVEPGEVEAHLRAYLGVREAAVVGRPGPDGMLRLVAFVVADSASAASTGAWRDHLARSLTPAMIPSAFVVLPEMPTNANGKTDMALLRAMPIAAPTPTEAPVAPRSETEARLLAIWEAVLGFGGFGVDDSFFALGGDSLMAIQVMVTVERDFDYPMPVALFAKDPTIAAIARAIADDVREDDHVRVVPLRSAGALPPLILLPPTGGGPGTYMTLARALPPDQPVYTAHLVGARDRVGFEASLTRLAAVYVAQLRRDFAGTPLRLGGYSSGGMMAFEVARQLEALGHPVDCVLLLDTAMTSLRPPEAALVPWWRSVARLLMLAMQRRNGGRLPGAIAGLLALKARLRRAGAPADSTPSNAAMPTSETGRADAPSAVPTDDLPVLSLDELLLQRCVDAMPHLAVGGGAAMRALLTRFRALPRDERRAALFAFLDGHTSVVADLAEASLSSGQRRRIAHGSFVLLEALRYYRPASPLRAPLVVVKAEGSVHGASGDMGWRPWTLGTLTVVDAPGDHWSMMKSPQLDVAASRLWKALEATAVARPEPS